MNPNKFLRQNLTKNPQVSAIHQSYSELVVSGNCAINCQHFVKVLRYKEFLKLGRGPAKLSQVYF